jgi:hypothetical protein
MGLVATAEQAFSGDAGMAALKGSSTVGRYRN